MSGSGLVYMLVLLGYNAVSHEVTSTREMSWHISHSECLRVLSCERNNGRSETYNQKYVCVPVVDHEMRSIVENSPHPNYPRRYGSGKLTLRGCR